MSELIIFIIILGLIVLSGVLALLVEEIEKVSIIRHKRRVKFLREHPTVAQDSKGNLTIL